MMNAYFKSAHGNQRSYDQSGTYPKSARNPNTVFEGQYINCYQFVIMSKIVGAIYIRMFMQKVLMQSNQYLFAALLRRLKQKESY